MPRPGPRPYECVKRAWHSDRHQPIRGSLIREIFRIANEIHNPTTRKNKEWQEKLPSVVFKAEEILYSKASSEDEYVELSTLWERVNDAVDTIIRRDDVNESGNLLLPCIEAALTVGCVPRRASRSQRHSNPRCYLSSSGAEDGRDGSSAVASSSQRTAIDGSKCPFSLQMVPHWFNRLLPEIQRPRGFHEKTTDSSGRVYPLCYLNSSSLPGARRSSGLWKESGTNEVSGEEEDDEGECNLSLRLSLPESCSPRKRTKAQYLNSDGAGTCLKQRCLAGERFYAPGNCRR